MPVNSLTTTPVVAGRVITDIFYPLVCSETLVCSAYLSPEDGDLVTLTTTPA